MKLLEQHDNYKKIIKLAKPFIDKGSFIMSDKRFKVIMSFNEFELILTIIKETQYKKKFLSVELSKICKGESSLFYKNDFENKQHTFDGLPFMDLIDQMENYDIFKDISSLDIKTSLYINGKFDLLKISKNDFLNIIINGIHCPEEKHSIVLWEKLKKINVPWVDRTFLSTYRWKNKENSYYIYNTKLKGILIGNIENSSNNILRFDDVFEYDFSSYDDIEKKKEENEPIKKIKALNLEV